MTNDTMMFQGKKFKSFLFPDIFDMKTGYYNKKPNMDPHGTIPFLGGTDLNNGITGFTTLFNIDNASATAHNGLGLRDDKIFHAPCLVVTNDGSIGHCYYQKKDFTCSHSVTILHFSHEENENIACFLAAMIENEGRKFRYSMKWRMNRMINSHIWLPVDSNDDPDWAYMDKYIQEIQAKYLREKQAEYDHRVSTFDEVIGDDKLDEQECQAVLDRYQKAQFGKFRIGDLFNIDTANWYKISKTALLSGDGTVPLISNSSSNNGITGWTETHPNNKGGVITYSDTTTGADTFFYQKDGFVGYSHVKKLILKDTLLTNNLAHYFITAIHTAMIGKYDWGNKLNNRSVNRTNLILPIHSFGQPDYDLMNDYIKCIQMRVLSSLRNYLNQRLNIAYDFING